MPAFTLISIEPSGGLYRRALVQATGQNPYATGGEAGLKNTIGFTEIKMVHAQPLNVASQDYGLVWAESTGKVIYATEGAQVANGTDLSGLSFMLEVVGL